MWTLKSRSFGQTRIEKRLAASAAMRWRMREIHQTRTNLSIITMVVPLRFWFDFDSTSENKTPASYRRKPVSRAMQCALQNLDTGFRRYDVVAYLKLLHGSPDIPGP